MTGLLLVESCKQSEVITAPSDIETVKEASMHLKPGEKVTAHDMLYALMLRSANDGAYAIAMHISGSVSGFAKLMNQRAKQIGCTNTHFNNPNGLNDSEHTTSAHDLALIARAAMKYPVFREVVKTYKYEINRSINTKDRWMINHDKLLKKDTSTDGVKTGYTVPAGHCFVGSATRHGFRVITAVMKSNHWQQDNETLVDWAFKRFEKKEDIPAWTVVGAVKVPGGSNPSVPVAVSQEAYTIGIVGTTPPRPLETVVAMKHLEAPIKKGQRVGDLVIKDSDGWVQKIPVVATESVEASSIVARAKAQGSSPWWLGGAAFVGVVWVNGRMRRKVKYYGRTGSKIRR